MSQGSSDVTSDSWRLEPDIICLCDLVYFIFKGFGIRNLQYEIRIRQKSHITVTIAIYVWTVARNLMKQTLNKCLEVKILQGFLPVFHKFHSISLMVLTSLLALSIASTNMLSGTINLGLAVKDKVQKRSILGINTNSAKICQ